MLKFASESTFHGVSFIFGENRSKFVRVLWIFLLFASLCGFSYYFRLAYIKWSVKPDISLRITDVSSKEIPLPAVTICPMRFARSDEVNFGKFTIAAKERKLFDATQAECEHLFANMNWCGQGFALDFMLFFCKNHFTKLEELNILDVVNKSAFSNDELFSSKISNMFTRIFTGCGICFTFNMQDFSAIFNDEIHDDFKCYKNHQHPDVEWNVEQGYVNKNSTYPENALKKALPFGAMMNPIEADNACSSKSLYVMFNLPNEMPNEFSEGLMLNYGTQSTIRLKVKSHRTNDNLRSYSPDIRKCYFEGEKKLEFFKTYIKSHCLVECKTKVMLNACGCVIFWMPRSKTTRLCRLSDLTCLSKKEASMQEEDQAACGCLLPCNDIRYTFETSTINMDPKMFYVDRKDVVSTMMFIAPIADTIEEIEDFVTYTLENFIADVGGFLGLFLGCSLLSIVEVFYFLSAALIRFALRYRTNPKVRNEEKESTDHEQMVELLHELRRDMDRGFKEIVMRVVKLEDNLIKVEEF